MCLDLQISLIKSMFSMYRRATSVLCPLQAFLSSRFEKSVSYGRCLEWLVQLSLKTFDRSRYRRMFLRIGSSERFLNSRSRLILGSRMSSTHSESSSKDLGA